MCHHIDEVIKYRFNYTTMYKIALHEHEPTTLLYRIIGGGG